MADGDNVTSVISQYKDLVNRNQVSGQERNIDYWRKQGWAAFSELVKDRATSPSATQIKRSKLPGESIKLIDDATWLVVVPLDKDASCHYGRGTDWCTDNPKQDHVEAYFYTKRGTVVYFINRQTGSNWAIVFTSYGTELFDQEDYSIGVQDFEDDTGFSVAQISRMVRSPDIQVRARQFNQPHAGMGEESS